MRASIFQCVQLPVKYFDPGGQQSLDWIRQIDMAPVYRALKRQYQVLKLHYPGQLLVIKSPAHILSLAALAEAWPDARIVHLHRDPATAAGSFCSLTEDVKEKSMTICEIIPGMKTVFTSTHCNAMV